MLNAKTEPSARPARAPGGSSELQNDVLRYAARGWSRERIARQMGLPPGTIEELFAEALRVLVATRRTLS